MFAGLPDEKSRLWLDHFGFIVSQATEVVICLGMKL
jgi:hypothetical protein